MPSYTTFHPFPLINMQPERCPWCVNDPLYIKYHDEEWGKLVTDDRILFEYLILEGAQAGLSWLTILKKRENYRKAFDHFDPAKVARFDRKKIDLLLANDGIIRNRLKITSAINNAKLFLDMQKEFGSFGNYLKKYFPAGFPIVNNLKTLKDIPISTPVSDAISNDMKKRGFKFFGTTTCYSFLQATGYVNDHLINCPSR